MRVQREGQNPKEGSLESKAVCQTLLKAFEMSRATAKVSQKHLRKDDQEQLGRQKDQRQNAPYGIYTGDQRGGCRLIDVKNLTVKDLFINFRQT